jgi:UDP-MurNAc hydroxylase
MFGPERWEYFAEQQASRRAEIAEEEASRAPILPPDEMLAALKEWWEPLLRRGRIFREGVGGPVRYTIGELDMVVDFPKAKVREYAGEETGYWFTIPADLVSTNIRDHEIDWSNSIFLSMQFQAGRVGKFNEFIYTFMKCLSRDRIEYVENWYAEQSDVSEDVQLGDWVLQRRCPHLRADLSKTGRIEDGVLTCSLHDWKWDLTSGKCLTTHGHPIRSRQAEDDLARAAMAPAS